MYISGGTDAGANDAACEDRSLIDALRESEECFRSAFEHAAIGMALVALDGRWQRVNRSLCEIVGLSEAELLATNFQSITHPQDLDLDLEYVRRLIAGEIRTYQMTKRYFHRDGRVVWVLLSVSLVRGKLREPLYFIAQIQDISERKAAEDALLESEAKFRQLVAQAVDGVFVHDRRGRILDANPHACKSLDYTREELTALSVFDFEVGCGPDELKAMWRNLSPGEAVTVTGRHRRKDGTTFPVEVRVGLLDSGGSQRVIALVRDVSDRVRHDAFERDRREVLELVAKGGSVEESARRLAGIIERRMPGAIAVFMTLRDGEIAVVGPSLPEQLAAVIRSRPLTAAVTLCDNVARERRPMRHDLREGPPWPEFRRAARACGLAGCWTFPIDASDGAPLGVFALLRAEASAPTELERDLCDSVTSLAALAVERHQMSDILARRASHDPLTGLCNRAVLNERLVDACDAANRGAGRGALFLLDLDRFKQINDRLGHDAGDELLQQFAQRVKETLRDCDTFARLGGDEFAILLPGVADRDQAATVAGRIAAALVHPLPLTSGPLLASVSIGGSLCPADGETPSALLKSADRALYRVKENGRGGFDMGALPIPPGVA